MVVCWSFRFTLAALMLSVIWIGRGWAVELASSHPSSDATDVPVSAAIHLRFSDALRVDSLNGLRLLRNDASVSVRRSTDLTNASITLAPLEFLEPNATYVVVGKRTVRGVDGSELSPFRFKFRTGTEQLDRVNRLVFEPTKFDDTRSMTTVLFGPDRRLYAASAFGELVCWRVDRLGRPEGRTVLDQDPRSSRQYIDLEWDPSANAENLVLWVSYAERLSADPQRRYFTGVIERLTVEENRVVKRDQVVVGLPHGREKQGGFETLPHQPNGLCFHQGKLYQSVGSTSSSGGPPNWGVEEQPLSAAILEIDYQRIDAPLDVHPATGFDPTAPSSPLRLFATGVRNALEILAHSNGRLYTAVNINDRGKPSDGVPDSPHIPGDQNKLIRKTTPNHESLYILERGRHYGFPNPARGQYVLAGGNPTAKVDPFEIDDYPEGVPPDSGFAPELMYPIWKWGGTSPNGMIEYQSRSHALRGALLCCFYSAGDIAAMTLGSDGLPTRIDKLRSPRGKLPFRGPLDITQDPLSGSLYVTDFGTQNKFGADGGMIWLAPAGKK